MLDNPRPPYDHRRLFTLLIWLVLLFAIGAIVSRLSVITAPAYFAVGWYNRQITRWVERVILRCRD